jgi:hypothetical protein
MTTGSSGLDSSGPRPAPGPVTARMEDQVERWQAVADRRAIFLGCYLMMTRNMLEGVRAAEFDDPAWVLRLLHHFADYYFDALADYEQAPATTAAVWRDAHDRCRDDRLHPVQLLLLGVNAHINYDLVLALEDLLAPEWDRLSPARRQARYEDHCRVNDVIGRTIDAVQDEIMEKAAPEMDVVDRALGPVDEWAISRLISQWRESVWQHAVDVLRMTDPDERTSAIRRLEAKTLERADAILLQGFPLSLSRLRS